MTNRTYKSILDVFAKLKKDKLKTKEIKENCSLKTDSVYQTLSRAVRDKIISRDENGFYFILDKENED